MRAFGSASTSVSHTQWEAHQSSHAQPKCDHSQDLGYGCCSQTRCIAAIKLRQRPGLPYCTCRRTKWQFFQPDNRKRAHATGDDQEDDSSQAAPDSDAEEEPDESGEEDDGSEPENASRREPKKRKRTWRKEEDSAVLWNIVKHVLPNPCSSTCLGTHRIYQTSTMPFQMFCCV